jgi:hypothetical protein
VQALETVGRFALGAQNQGRFGVGGADECPTVIGDDAGAIHINDLIAIPLEVLHDFGDDFKLDGIVAMDAHFGRGVIAGHIR